MADKMEKSDRKAARAAYVERESRWAVVVVRIGAQAWVTLTADSAAYARRLDFSLRTGGDAAPGMREAYREAGAVTVDELARLDPTLSKMARETEGAALVAAFAEELGARAS